VLNGIERLESASAARTNGPYRIVHLGSLYHKRDPFPFLRGLAELRKRGQIPARGLVVDLVGKCHEYKGISLAQAARELGIEDLLSFRTWVPHQEARKLAAEADLLLLLAQDQPDQIPNKLYDYLGAGPRILAFTEETGETGTMLNEVGGHLVVSDPRTETVSTVLHAALNDAASLERGPRREVLEGWSTERQMARLLGILTKGADPS
jgi:glycosyltransferase involved in cell wall biosynthesis